MMLNRYLAVFVLSFMIFTGCKERYPQGKRLYEHHCSSCHMSDGTGLVGLIPPIKASDYLISNFDKLPCIIKYGLFDTIQVNQKEYSEIMIGIPDLNGVQISNIMRYIANNFIISSHQKLYKVQEVDSIIQSCK